MVSGKDLRIYLPGGGGTCRRGGRPAWGLVGLTEEEMPDRGEGGARAPGEDGGRREEEEE